MLEGGDPTRLLLPNSPQTPREWWLVRWMSRVPRSNLGGFRGGWDCFLPLQSIWHHSFPLVHDPANLLSPLVWLRHSSLLTPIHLFPFSCQSETVNNLWATLLSQLPI